MLGQSSSTHSVLHEPLVYVDASLGTVSSSAVASDEAPAEPRQDTLTCRAHLPDSLARLPGFPTGFPTLRVPADEAQSSVQKVPAGQRWRPLHAGACCFDRRTTTCLLLSLGSGRVVEIELIKLPHPAVSVPFIAIPKAALMGWISLRKGKDRHCRPSRQAGGKLTSWHGYSVRVTRLAVTCLRPRQ